MRRLLLCALTVAVAGCPGSDPEWTVLRDGDNLDRVVLSAWGDGEVTYFAGGGLGNGANALALRLEGGEFSELAITTEDTFWWVWAPDASTAYFVGENGAVYRNTEKIDQVPTSLTLYGVWGSSATDIWIVGGDALASTPTFALLHYDGISTWTDYTAMVDGAVGGALFKVWGAGPDAVWASGQAGTILRWNGSGWKTEQSGSTAPLFTVHGSGVSDVWAVGGPQATILRSSGDGSWSQIDPGIPASVFNGVSVSQDGSEVLVVGMSGVKLRYSDGAWFDDTFEPPPFDLHAALVDPKGDAYAVGGNFYAPGTPTTVRVGIIARYR